MLDAMVVYWTMLILAERIESDGGMDPQKHRFALNLEDGALSVYKADAKGRCIGLGVRGQYTDGAAGQYHEEMVVRDGQETSDAKANTAWLNLGMSND